MSSLRFCTLFPDRNVSRLRRRSLAAVNPSQAQPLPNLRRRGFTLVELLVVIAIIGVMVGLLLPAVQAAREAARRSQCTNNLKQIALGIHNYHDTYRKFSAGYYQFPTGPANESTWITHLLPFIEQKNLFDGIEHWQGFGGPPAGSGVHRVTSTFIPTLICPSDFEVELVLTNWARGNYAGNNGIGPMFTEGQNSVARGPNGVFRQNRSRSMAEMIDGTSNTVMVAELLKSPEQDFRGVMHYPEGPLYHHNQAPNSAIPDQFRSGLCASIPRAPCIGTYTAWNNRSVVLSARSLHPGGANVALVDGSVRLVSDTVNLTTWQNLGIPDDGATLGEF